MTYKKPGFPTTKNQDSQPFFVWHTKWSNTIFMLILFLSFHLNFLQKRDSQSYFFVFAQTSAIFEEKNKLGLI